MVRLEDFFIEVLGHRHVAYLQVPPTTHLLMTGLAKLQRGSFPWPAGHGASVPTQEKQWSMRELMYLLLMCCPLQLEYCDGGDLSALIRRDALLLQHRGRIMLDDRTVRNVLAQVRLPLHPPWPVLLR